MRAVHAVHSYCDREDTKLMDGVNFSRSSRAAYMDVGARLPFDESFKTNGRGACENEPVDVRIRGSINLFFSRDWACLKPLSVCFMMEDAGQSYRLLSALGCHHHESEFSR